jgi:hypothetical protein
MVMLYKSCSVFDKKSNKISFAFFLFSTIFYEFYKNQQKANTILDFFRLGPCNFSSLYKYAPASRLWP